MHLLIWPLKFERSTTPIPFPNFTAVVLEQISFMSVIVYFVVCAYLDSLHSHMCECTYMWVSAVTPVHCQRTDNVQQHLKIMACNGKWLNATFCICSVTRTDINSVLLEQYARMYVRMCGYVHISFSVFTPFICHMDWLTDLWVVIQQLRFMQHMINVVLLLQFELMSPNSLLSDRAEIFSFPYSSWILRRYFFEKIFFSGSRTNWKKLQWVSKKSKQKTWSSAGPIF